MKRMLWIFLTMFVLVCILPISARALHGISAEHTQREVRAFAPPEIIAQGASGEPLVWTLDSSGTLVLSETGDLTRYTLGSVPWHAYRDSIVRVIICEGVTSLCDYMFYDTNHLEEVIFNTADLPVDASWDHVFGYAGADSDGIKVTIGPKVTHIPDGLFCEVGVAVPNVTELVFEEGSACVSIGNSAFTHCRNLTVAALPEKLVTIGIQAFYCCDLRSITIPETVRSIGNNAFRGNDHLQELHFNAVSMNDSEYKSGIFDSAGSLADGFTLTIGSGVTRIPAYFISPDLGSASAPKVTNVVFEEGSVCESIGEIAFGFVPALEQINLPDSLQTIGESAFYRCVSLKEITIPENVTHIGSRAFSYCHNMHTIRLNGSLLDMDSSYNVFNEVGLNTTTKVVIGANATVIPDDLFTMSGLDVPNPNIVSVVFEEGSKCERIGINAFIDCTSLKEVILPDGLKEIGTSAFNGCSSLEKVVIPGSVETMGYSCFGDCPKLITAGPADGAYDIRFGWTQTLPDALFLGANYLESITFPDSICNIPSRAFYNCYNLKSVVIPESVTSIGKEAFYRCTSLEQISYNAAAVEDLNYANKVFCLAGTKGAGITLTLGKNVERIPAYLFRPTSSETETPNLNAVVFNGDRCESIGANAFEGAAMLRSVNFPEGLRSIEKNAFLGCTSLQRADLPDSLVTLGAYAFQGCAGMEYLRLPRDLKSLPSRAFAYCYGLKEIRYDCTVMEDFTASNQCFAFAGTDGKGITVRIGDNVEMIPAYLFEPNTYTGENYANIVRVRFGENSICKSIGEHAFGNCIALRKINVPRSVTTIGSLAFRECTSLTSAGPTGSGADYQFGWVDTIPDNAFYGCENLKTVVLPDSITQIGQRAFYQCNALAQVSTPPKLEYVGNEAFYDCIGLTSITIPQNVEFLGGKAFADCENVAFLRFNAADVTLGGKDIFLGCGSQTDGMQVVFGKNVTEVPAHLFERTPASAIEVPYIRTVDFAVGSRCNTIGAFSFFRCNRVEVMEIPENMERVMEDAFNTCSIQEVYFGGSEEDWKEKVLIFAGNDTLRWPNIQYETHYSSNEPEEPEAEPTSSSGMVMYLRDWDAQSQTATFGLNVETPWHTSEETAPEFLTNAAEMVGRFVLVEVLVPDNILINAVPVETKMGYVSAADTVSFVIDGVPYDTPDDWTLPWVYEGKEVVYHLNAGELVGISSIQTETGILQYWNSSTGTLSIDPDGLSKGLCDYLLSSLAKDESLQFLGKSGHTYVAVQYSRDDYGFLYSIGSYTPPDGPDFFGSYAPPSPEQERFYEIAENWKESYEELTNAAYQALIALAGSTEETRNDVISRRADAMKKSDSQSGSKYLNGDLGPYTDEAYRALSEFLYDYTCKHAEFASTDLSDSLAGVTIVNNVLKAMWNQSQEYRYEDASITICASGYGSTALGEMTIVPYAEEETYSLMICSNQADSEAAVSAFLDELSGLATNAAYNVVNSVYKDILGKSLSSLTKEYVSRSVAKIERNAAVKLAEKFQHAGVGNLIQTLDTCYTYYSWVYEAANRGNLDDLETALREVQDLKFEDKTIRDAATNIAMKGLKKAAKAMQNAYEDYLKELGSEQPPVFGKTYINCPVNVSVYLASGTQIGYVGIDDIWYSDEIRITEAGGAKQIISYTDELLTFEIVATDYGKLSCSFEEYDDDGTPVGRLNYYDIPIAPSQMLTVSLEEDLEANADTLTIDTNGERIKPSVYIDVEQSASVLIKCQSDEGGRVAGAGLHICGDAVVLTALPNVGFGFSGWYEGDVLVCADAVYEFTAMQDRDLSARFHTEEYVYVSVSATPGGSAIGSGRYLEGQTATVAAIPHTHFAFTGWYRDDILVSVDPTYQFVATGDIELTACFVCASHEMTEPVFSWSADMQECAAQFTCAWCGAQTRVRCTITTLTTPPTESEPGSIVYTAGVEMDGRIYEDTMTVTIPATGHVVHTTTLVPAVESTCQQRGNIAYYICTGCDLWFKDAQATTVIADHSSVILPLADHVYEATVTEPTCTGQGYTFYACVCGEHYTADYVEPVGHAYTDWVVLRAPTVAEEGVEERSCTRCQHTEQHSIPKLKNPFTDVEPGSFYYDPVMWAVGKGITNGTSDNTFSPNVQCMRAHVVTFLWRAVGSPEPERTDTPFVDVKPKDFYYEAVLWALENGITSGMDATHFGPTAYCNRAQVVTFLYRTMGTPEVTTTENPFTDVTDGQWFTTPVLWAVENGITNGLSATGFGPNAICNRAQIVTFLYRAFVTE